MSNSILNFEYLKGLFVTEIYGSCELISALCDSIYFTQSQNSDLICLIWSFLEFEKWERNEFHFVKNLLFCIRRHGNGKENSLNNCDGRNSLKTEGLLKFNTLEEDENIFNFLLCLPKFNPNSMLSESYQNDSSSSLPEEISEHSDYLIFEVLEYGSLLFSFYFLVGWGVIFYPMLEIFFRFLLTFFTKIVNVGFCSLFYFNASKNA